MRIVNKNTIVPKNEKGYQSVKLYIPNDTLMGLNTKTLENNNKERRKKNTTRSHSRSKQSPQ